MELTVSTYHFYSNFFSNYVKCITMYNHLVYMLCKVPCQELYLVNLFI